MADLPSEYKIVTIKKVYFDFKTFILGVLLFAIGVRVAIIAFREIAKSSYLYIILLLFGLLIVFIGLGKFFELFTKRDKKIKIRKSDDEILDELIALESLADETIKVVPNKAIIAAKITNVIPNKVLAPDNKTKASWQPNFYDSSIVVTVNVQNTIDNFNKSPSVSDLLVQKNINNIYYADLLSCFEWRFKRLRILIRDDFACKICRNINIDNHVHHTYYIQDRLPWEIDDDALETLCPECHKSVHETKEIPIKKMSKSGAIGLATIASFYCTKCGGTGYRPEFNYNENGICFYCKKDNLKNATFKTPLLNIKNGKVIYDVGFARREYREYQY